MGRQLRTDDWDLNTFCVRAIFTVSLNVPPQPSKQSWFYNKIPANQAESIDDDAWTRLAYAGLTHCSWGAVDYGRNYGIIYGVEQYIDRLPEFGCNSYTQSDIFMTGLTHGLLAYRNKKLLGLVEDLNIDL
ncbi:porin [Citrobacter cronae]|uniref:porin n=1 Tax=Citrobacter cronae TaxID=1748967 RepID=UPI0021CF6F7D|nr:porin [Citrobacter cronae]MCU6173008.1 porin [Citrobacter cronae]